MTSDLERSTMRRIYWRIIPLFWFAVFFSYLDRINIGFAGLQMNQDLHFSGSVFGFGASVFFVGYMLLEVPSNLLLTRLGARIWFARILISWGLVAALMAFVWSDTSFYVARLLLGAAEAGLFPGLAFYLTAWFPSGYRARAVGGYIIGGQLSAVIGGPVSTALMTYCDAWLGLRGWQWMFLVEGVLTVVLGVVFLFLLTDSPERATWLTAEQRSWLRDRLATERAAIDHDRHSPLWGVLADGRAWSLAALFGCALVGVYGLLIWLPQIVRSMGSLSYIEVGFLTALPSLLGIVATLVVSRSSDRTGDRKIHLAGVYFLARIGLAGSALISDPIIAYVFLCIAMFGTGGGNSLFWSVGSSLMTGAAGAVCIAFINTVAQIGGLIGPWMIGAVRDLTGSYSLALLFLAAFLLIAAIVALLLRVARPDVAPGRAAVHPVGREEFL